jgi:2-dehydropantoate 2-reductase
LDCRNGGLDDAQGHEIFKMLLSEIIPAVPELDMSEDAILAIVQQVTHRTRLNQNSMNRDMHAGANTELEYITGYLLERGRERGVPMPRNELLHRLVSKKIKLSN